MDTSLLQLAFIYTPGLLWAYIDRTHGFDREAAFGFFLVKVHLFGTLTYIVSILFLLIPWVLINLVSLYFSFNVLSYLGPYYFWIIISTSVPMSLILARLYLKLNINGVFTEYLKRHNAYFDNKSDELWSFAINEITNRGRQINIIDTEFELKYSGTHVSSLGDGKNREIFLKDAIVSNLDGKQISKAKYMHILRPIEKIRLELPEN